MSDSSDPKTGATPVTNAPDFPAQGNQSNRTSIGGYLQWEPPAIDEAARLFPNYEILGLLGRGGMGVVYRARQVALDRTVAIKLMPLEVSVEKEFADRFVHEARAMAKLHHPNIIEVYDFGTTKEGHLFFVMEFVEGANLHAIIHEVGLNPAQALSLTRQICTALTYAHGKGVVHRDIKPANVMVDGESHVKIADFGLARLTTTTPEMQGMTMPGMVMGTPDYMAPEQKRAMDVDHRADIYSVGVMLYEMLCREVPQGAFDLPSRRIGCDTRLDAIVLKAMQQSPERRYQTTQEMKADVENARKPVPGAPVPQPHAVVPKATPAARVPQPVARATIPRRPVAKRRVPPVVTKSQAPLYIGVAIAALAVIIVVGIASRESEPKQVAKRRAPPVSEVAKGRPSANPPATKLIPSPASQTPAPVAETPKEQPMPNPPEAKPAPAPGPATPTLPPATNPMTATEKWIAEQEPQWQSAFAVEVSAPFEKSAADLKKQYLNALDAQLTAATRTGEPGAAVAFRDEIQRLSGSDTPGEDDALAPGGLKALRAGYRKNLATLEAARTARAKAVFARYDAIIASNLALLNQHQRLDEALQLKAKRDELAATWIKPSPPADAPRLPPATMPALEPAKAPPVASLPGLKFGGVRTADATKERPFENSLGMRFVPVPITGGPSGGQRVLFSIWETRVQDYEVYANEKKVPWPKPGFPQGATHPAVNITWDNAQAFCTWLTDSERRGGRLAADERYRLPTDHEWSCAVGIGEQEDPAKTPAQKHQKIADIYPWGKTWPPPTRAGNYAGVESKGHKIDGDVGVLEGYRDGTQYTAGVGRFSANRFGLYDLGGNAWEWCEDLFKPGGETRVLRGASFANHTSAQLWSSFRLDPQPLARPFFGFRVVVTAAEPAK